MKFAKYLCWILVGTALFSGCRKPAGTVASPVETNLVPYLSHAQPKLPTVKVWVGDQELVAEIARKGVEIATGMMFRTNMLENEAMMFVFPDAARRNFYMRNCVIPLSAAYINPKGEILETINMDPGDEKGIVSASDDIQFVLEVPQGWFVRHNISTGAIVRTERGTLAETFFGRQ